MSEETNNLPSQDVADSERSGDRRLSTCSACIGVLRRNEHPEYFNGFAESGGACWTSSKTENQRVDSTEICRIIEKLAASPWLRTMEGLRWEYLPNDQVDLTGPRCGPNSKKDVMAG